jgi:hypothetical protein
MDDRGFLILLPALELIQSSIKLATETLFLGAEKPDPEPDHFPLRIASDNEILRSICLSIVVQKEEILVYIF